MLSNMATPGHRIAACLLALLALATAGDRATAQERPRLFLDPPAQTVGLADGPFEVRLMVDDVATDEGLGGYTLAVAYDPAVVRGVAIEDSGYVSSTDNPVLCPATGIDNDAGRLAHFCFTIPVFFQPGPRTSEPRVLARVTFEPVGEGTTTLDIGESSIADPEGNQLPAARAHGEVTVGGGPGGPGTAPGEATSDATAPTSGLPASGTRDGGSDRTGLFLALLIAGIGGVALAGTFLAVRMRRRGTRDG